MAKRKHRAKPGKAARHPLSEAAQTALAQASRFLQAGDPAAASIVLDALLASHPKDPRVNYLLGMAAADMDDMDKALRHLDTARRLAPDNPGFQFAAGTAFANQDRFDEAADAFRAAIRGAPDVADGYSALALVLYKARRFKEAVPVFPEAIRREPHVIRHYLNAAANQLALTDGVAASALLDQAAEQAQGATAEELADLGRMYQAQFATEKAQRVYQAALAVQPDSPEILDSLARSLAAAHRVEDAVGKFRQAALARGEPAEAADLRIGTALGEAGLVAAAFEYFDAALARNPHDFAVRSDRLIYRNYLPGTSEDDLFQAHVEAGKCLDATAPTAFENVPDPGRTLNVGYVSADLRRHSVAYFLEPVLAHHDKRRVRVHCYSNAAQFDVVSKRMRRHCHKWTDIHTMDDDAVVEAIRRDGIDILVDLSGHTAGNRLTMFAQKPAPVQVSWLGYPNTSGMVQMDYRLTDDTADPAGQTDHWHTEQLVRLPRVFSCYLPPADAPPVTAPPVEQNGYVTFGCFNNLNKLNDRVYGAWARLLSGVPDARLVLKGSGFENPAMTEHVRRLFAQQGVDGKRLLLLGRDTDGGAHLARYGDVDIGLDPFPYCGTTTTCEALWMGVPVVTLAGVSHRARVGASQLSAIGMPELVAENEDQYIDIATELANDRTRLKDYRASMRRRLGTSPLMDHAGFTTELEAAYRDMWVAWCDSSPAGH